MSVIYILNNTSTCFQIHTPQDCEQWSQFTPKSSSAFMTTINFDVINTKAYVAFQSFVLIRWRFCKILFNLKPVVLIKYVILNSRLKKKHDDLCITFTYWVACVTLVASDKLLLFSSYIIPLRGSLENYSFSSNRRKKRISDIIIIVLHFR